MSSVRTPATRHCENRAHQQIKIEPDGPVTEVVGIERFLLSGASLAAKRDLPEARDPGAHALAKLSEGRRELLEVVVGKWTRADKAHISAQHIPELRQLIDAETPEETSDAWNQSRVAPQLVGREPLVPILGVCREIVIELPIRIPSHRPDLLDVYPTAAQPGASLPEEHRTAVNHPHGEGAERDDRGHEEQRHAADQEI